jgi:GNAT superfamily N-acetyltransferase
MEIRELTDNDLDSLLALYSQLDPSANTCVSDKALDAWNRAKSMGSVHYIGAIDGGKVLSTCYCAIIPNLTHGARPICFIENVVTDEKHRSMGLGRKVISRAIEIARAHGCYKAILQSSAKREGAHEFYRKLGFSDDTKIAFDLRLDQ